MPRDPAAAPSPLAVAIDGPAGVGKSTTARLLAQRLGIPYLDTGAMYRTVALDLLARGVDLGDRAAVEAAATDCDLRLERSPDGDLVVLLGGVPVGEKLRAPRVSEATSRIATYPGVRSRLVALQRAAAQRWGGVVEGRDIGTRVLPGTPFKFFLDAPDAVRVARRRAQLDAAGRSASAAEVESEVLARDARDRGRAESPLRCTPDYLRIDTSFGPPEVVVERILAAIVEIRERARAASPR